MACTLNKETEMTVAGIGIVLCVAAAFEIEEEEKEARDEEARRQVQVKRRKKVKDWLKRRVQLGHNRTLLYELEEEDIASFKNYLKGPLGMRHFQCCQFWKFSLYEAI